MSASTETNASLDHAMFYAGLGWAVVPSHKAVRLESGEISCTCSAGTSCISPGKHPALKSWSQFTKTRPTQAHIENWFTGEFKGYGVGIITGRVSGLFVVDVDVGPGKQGEETLNALQIMYGDIPHTVEAKTGGGGRHILLGHPGTKDIGTAKNVLGPGVDVRGDGGFIVTAPSFHANGRSYLWSEHSHPKITEIAEAPSWVIDMAQATAPRAEGSRAASTGTGEIIRDAWGKVTDGRERHMVGVICGVIATKLKQTSTLPTAEDVFAESWPTYERTTRARGASLEADQRGETLMRQRIAHFLRRASAGKWKINSDPENDNATTIDATQSEQQKGKTRESLRMLSIAELEALPPPTWLVHGLVPERSLVVPYGPPKKGKTFVILSMGLHIAAGMDWAGKKVEQGGVVYIAGEGVGGLGLRIKAMRAHYGISDRIPFWVIPKAINFGDQAAVEGLVKLVRDTVLDEPIGLVVVDTLARAAPGVEENSSKEMGVVIAACDYVKDALECTVMPIHHAGKDEAKGLRGSSAIHGAVDASFHITGTGKSVTLKPIDQKDAEPGEPMVFEMVEVMVGIGRSSLVPVLAGTGGTNGTSAGQTENVPFETKLSTAEILALRALDHALSMHSEIVSGHSNVPSNVPLIKEAFWREAFRDSRAGDTPDAIKKAFQRVSQSLVLKRLVCFKAPYVWKVRGDEGMQ